MDFIHDSLVVKTRLLTSCCPACAEIKEIPYVPAEMAAFVKDVPVYNEARRQRIEWDVQHAKECKRMPVLLSA